MKIDVKNLRDHVPNLGVFPFKRRSSNGFLGLSFLSRQLVMWVVAGLILMAVAAFVVRWLSHAGAVEED